VSGELGNLTIPETYSGTLINKAITAASTSGANLVISFTQTVRGMKSSSSCALCINFNDVIIYRVSNGLVKARIGHSWPLQSRKSSSIEYNEEHGIRVNNFV